MSIYHTSLYNTDDNKPVTRLVKQELITYEQTEFGLKIAKLERSFTGAEYTDSYTSAPIVHPPLIFKGARLWIQIMNSSKP